MTISDTLKDWRQAIYDSIDWGSLSAPRLIDHVEDPTAVGDYPVIDVSLGEVDVSRSTAAKRVRLRGEAVIMVLTLADVEAYIEAIVKSLELGRVHEGIVIDTIESIEWGLLEGTGLWVGVIKLSTTAEAVL